MAEDTLDKDGFFLTKRVPSCLLCVHFRGNQSCDAFESIPDAILFGEHDHRTPFPGDHGILFEEGNQNGISTLPQG